MCHAGYHSFIMDSRVFFMSDSLDMLFYLSSMTDHFTYHKILDFDTSFLVFDRSNFDFDTSCHVNHNKIIGPQSHLG